MAILIYHSEWKSNLSFNINQNIAFIQLGWVFLSTFLAVTSHHFSFALLLNWFSYWLCNSQRQCWCQEKKSFRHFRLPQSGPARPGHISFWVIQSSTMIAIFYVDLNGLLQCSLKNSKSSIPDEMSFHFCMQWSSLPHPPSSRTLLFQTERL